MGQEGSEQESKRFPRKDTNSEGRGGTSLTASGHGSGREQVTSNTKKGLKRARISPRKKKEKTRRWPAQSQGEADKVWTKQVRKKKRVFEISEGEQQRTEEVNGPHEG